MKVGIRIEGPASGGREYFEAMLDYACEAERLGIDQAWSAEAWGMDAISPLAFLAARTQRMNLGTGIMQVCARTAASTAMTALSMQTATNATNCVKSAKTWSNSWLRLKSSLRTSPVGKMRKKCCCRRKKRALVSMKSRFLRLKRR
mgnify:CR=1 FL=1